MSDQPNATADATQRAIIVLACGFALVSVAFGVRATFGLFLNPINAEMGWSIGALSFAIAVQNLIWGAAQPVAGALADSRGSAVVIAGGAVLYALGLTTMAFADDLWVFNAGTGFIIGFAQAAIGFPVIFGAIGRTAPEDKRSLFLGIAAAGGSFGQFVFAPIGQTLLTQIGWANALLIMAAICLASAIFVFGVNREVRPNQVSQAGQDPDDAHVGIRDALRFAMGHRGFLLLNAGFFVCGFQLTFIVVHLPVFAPLCGLAAETGSTGISLIGVFNIIGTIAAGFIGARYRPKFPLSAIYLGRALAAAAMVLIPVTEFVLYGFAIVMGLLWLSTVPLTNGVVAQIFGPKHVGMLFGVVFFSHQLGSFVGAWLAGYLFDILGSYDVIWWLSAALGLFAALVHLPINDHRVKFQTASG